MAPSGILPSFDEVEERHLGLGMGSESLPIEQLAFQGREEALAHGIVVAVANRAHGRPVSGPTTATAKGGRGILRTLIGMVDDHLGAMLLESHLQGLQGQAGA